MSHYGAWSSGVSPVCRAGHFLGPSCSSLVSVSVLTPSCQDHTGNTSPASALSLRGAQLSRGRQTNTESSAKVASVVNRASWEKLGSVVAAHDKEPRPVILTLVTRPSTSANMLLETCSLQASHWVTCAHPLAARESGNVGFHWLLDYPQLCLSHPHAKYLKIQGVNIIRSRLIGFPLPSFVCIKHIISENPEFFLGFKTTETPITNKIVVF